MSDATVFVSIALLVVWMQRKKRWSLFFKAAEGSASLQSGGSTATAASTTPSTVSGPTGGPVTGNQLVNPPANPLGGTNLLRPGTAG